MIEATRFELMIDSLLRLGFTHSEAAKEAARRDPDAHAEFRESCKPERQKQPTILSERGDLMKDRKPCVVTDGKSTHLCWLVGFIEIQGEAHGVVTLRGEDRFEGDELKHYPFTSIRVFSNITEAQSAAAKQAEVPEPVKPKTSPAKTKRTQEPATV